MSVTPIPTAANALAQLKTMLTPRLLEQLDRDVFILERTIRRLPANQQSAQRRRLKWVKGRIQMLKKLATLLQWEVIDTQP